MEPSIEKILKDIESGKNVQVGRNRLTKKLGEGAFAYVFESSFDEFGRRKAAVKFPKSKAAEANIKTRQKILSALGDCPYTPNLVDLGTFGDTLYVAEELRSHSLADEIKANIADGKSPSIEETVTLGIQLFTGIDYFHRLKETNPSAAQLLGLACLPHCDIKPSNIVKFADATGDVVWQYTDFGLQSDAPSDIQLSFVSAASLASIKSIDEKLGRDIYAAPEVRQALLFDQKAPTTVTADLWSIGAVLFKYATGKTPEWGQADPTTLREDIPEPLVHVFATLLDGDPTKRYQSAAEARTALENVLNGRWCDSYIVGLARHGQDYSVFKQPMREGMPAGKFLSHTFSSITLPQVCYIPETRTTLIVNTLEKENSSSGKISVSVTSLDDAFNASSTEIDFFLYVTSPLTCSSIALKNKHTGQIALRTDVRYEFNLKEKRKETKVIDITALPKCVKLYEKMSAGFFGPWKQIEGSKYSPCEEFYIRIINGKITLGDYRGPTHTFGYDLGDRPSQILKAFWVPK